MRIGVMLRDIWNQTDAPGIIVLNMMDKILQHDKNNEYILFFRDGSFIDRYNRFPNAKAILVSAPSKLLWDQLAVPLAARRENVDLIFHPKHSVPLLTGRKTVMQLRGAEYWIYPEHFEFADIQYQKMFIPLFCKKATHLITESNDVDRDFRKYLGIKADKTTMIHLAQNERFKPVDDGNALENCRKKYGLPERFVLTVTRVLQNKKYYPGKNILNAVEAYRKCRSRKDVKFVVIGRETREFFASRFPADDDIHKDIIVLDFIAQEELPALYSLAEVFFFPSKYESFGIPILEAMACGCPVITSTAYSCPEVAGEAAVLVERTNITEMSEALDRVLSSVELQQQMRERGLENAAHYSWDKAAQETIRVFETHCK
jgi:glycosyltransferase involved in cell wall biosynthesis